MNVKELKEPVYQEKDYVLSGNTKYKNAIAVVFEGKTYAVNPNAILTINCTTKCNCSCFFCYNGRTFMRDEQYVSYESFELDRALSFAKKSKIRVVTLTGGEPTLCEQELFGVIQKIKSYGFQIIRLHTNGMFLSKSVRLGKKEQKLWMWLRELGVNELSISLADYRRDNNAKIMGIDTYNNVVSVLPIVANSDISLQLSCFVCESGVHTLEDFKGYLELAHRNGVKYVIFRIEPDYLKREAGLIRRIVTELQNLDWIVTYNHIKSDSIIYELRSLEKRIIISCVSEEIDADKKIRRLIYMPDRVLYTSWIDPSSYLFEDDSSKIVDSSQRHNYIPGAMYPGNVWKKPVPEYITKSMRFNIDLHVHSLVSDGVIPPSAVINAAKDAGIKQMVFTEHNSLHDSIEKLREYGSSIGVEIPMLGVEFSTVYCNNETPLMKFHLLIYGKNTGSFSFMENIFNPNEPKNNYLYEQYVRLKKQGIIDCEWKDIFKIDDKVAFSEKKMFTRTPLAEIISHKCGISVEKAKELYLSPMDEAQRYKAYLDTIEMINLAHANGCVAVLAHPGWIRSYNKNKIFNERDLFLAITDLARNGLDGIEVVHRLNDDDMRTKLYKLGSHLGLIISGGSDYHGKSRCVFGTNGIEKSQFDRILERIR